MPQVTAKSVKDVRLWIETTAHNSAFKEDNFFVLKGYCGDKLRIPINIWKRCFVKSGDDMDRRMFRWDHYAEMLNYRKSKIKKIKPIKAVGIDAEGKQEFLEVPG